MKGSFLYTVIIQWQDQQAYLYKCCLQDVSYHCFKRSAGLEAFQSMLPWEPLRDHLEKSVKWRTLVEISDPCMQAGAAQCCICQNTCRLESRQIISVVKPLCRKLFMTRQETAGLPRYEGMTADHVETPLSAKSVGIEKNWAYHTLTFMTNYL